MSPINRVLVLGSTGYVGSRLVTKLLKEGYIVRAGYRTREKLECMNWYQHPRLETMQIDVLNLASLEEGCKECDVVYYLIHSMYQGKRFAEIDLQAANNMVRASQVTGVKQIIYLGGLGDQEQHLSEHLSSRAKVSSVLHQGSTPATTLRAAMIIGAGSTSFEILRYLVERLPVMTTPKWLRTKSQPIAISNVLNYLSGCLKHPETMGRVFDIGGPEILSYTDLIRIYMEEADLPRRLIVPIPLLTPGLSSYWLALITPVPSAIARPLVGGLKNEAICTNDEITKIIPQTLLTNREAMKLALSQISHWFSKLQSEKILDISIPEWKHGCDPKWAGGDLNSLLQHTTISAKPKLVWRSVSKVIGSEGRNYGSWFWHILGRLDELTGGKGMKQRPKKRFKLAVGYVVDCWDIVDVIDNRYLKLSLKIRLPAKVSLEIGLASDSRPRTELFLRLVFSPKGFRGFLIWYALLPFWRHLLGKMLNRLNNQIDRSLIA